MFKAVKADSRIPLSHSEDFLHWNMFPMPLLNCIWSVFGLHIMIACSVLGLLIYAVGLCYILDFSQITLELVSKCLQSSQSTCFDVDSMAASTINFCNPNITWFVHFFSVGPILTPTSKWFNDCLDLCLLAQSAITIQNIDWILKSFI